MCQPEGRDHIGKIGLRYRLSVQEEPPNDWYVCVLCGTRFVTGCDRKHYCIIVITEDEHGMEVDRFYIPVHTDCVIARVGDPKVLLQVRRYSNEIRNRLQRARRARRQKEMEACKPRR